MKLSPDGCTIEPLTFVSSVRDAHCGAHSKESILDDLGQRKLNKPAKFKLVSLQLVRK